ncbi:hypothetical protein [Thermocrinis sp.]|uniref:hypothetical protein n=1 Tax=Thermocrinis sp. TaxID=2024383 RepID=UPI002FDE0F77
MEERWQVQIFVNGKEVKLKDFPQRAIYNILLGFVKSLKLNETPREVEIKVKVGKEENTGNT